MSNRNDRMQPEGSPEVSRHERLCEYVFGEIVGEERERFELELAGDAELRREHAELVATAEFVRETLPPEKLSDEMRATLSAAAAKGPARRRFTFLRGGGALRVAAGIFLVLGLGFAARTLMSKEESLFEDRTGSAGVARRVQLSQSRPQEEALALGEKPFDSTESFGKQAGVTIEPKATVPVGARAEGERGGEYASQTPLAAGKMPKFNAVRARSTEDSPAVLGYLGQQVDEAVRARPEALSGNSSRRNREGAGPSSVGSVLLPTQAPDPPARSDNDAFFLGGKKKKFSVGLESENRRSWESSRNPGKLRQSSASNSPGDGRVRLGTLDLEPLEALGYFGDEEDNAQPDNETAEAPISRLSLKEVRTLGAGIIADCILRPNETPSAMFFRSWGEHPFEWTVDDPLSTFSVDVDTASYTLARRYLRSGQLPPTEAVRTEEFLNYFRSDKDAPKGGEAFGLHVESAPSLFHDDPRVEMLRVTVRAEDVAEFERKPLALTFVVDVSGSMNSERIGLVKESLSLLLGQLYPTDAIALIGFNAEARVIFPMTSAARRGNVEGALLGLSTGGGTNVEAGLSAGYRMAAESLTPNAVNRVILLSDGVGNLGETDQERLLAEVEEHRGRGIYLNTIGVGMGNHNDHFLEQLADKGDGLCQYFDSAREARRVLVDQFTQTLQPVARDVKIQVEFDPEQVESYRQLGYENRVIADADFRNDAVDAGEVHAGHQVTALYEIVLAQGADRGKPLGSVSLRHKQPFSVDAGRTDASSRAAAERATEITIPLIDRNPSAGFRGMGWGYRRAVLVAQFAEVLRRSVHARSDSTETLLGQARALAEERRDPELMELLELIRLALPRLGEEARKRDGVLLALTDELRSLSYEKGRREQLAGDEGLELGQEEVHDERMRELQELIQSHLAARHGYAEVHEVPERLRDLGYDGEER